MRSGQKPQEASTKGTCKPSCNQCTTWQEFQIPKLPGLNQQGPRAWTSDTKKPDPERPSKLNPKARRGPNLNHWNRVPSKGSIVGFYIRGRNNCNRVSFYGSIVGCYIRSLNNWNRFFGAQYTNSYNKETPK